MARTLLDALPEFAQPRHALSRCIAGDQRGVDRADRGADDPVGLDPGLVHRFVNADLVCARRAAALQHQHRLTGNRWGAGSFRGAVAVGIASFARCHGCSSFAFAVSDRIGTYSGSQPDRCGFVYWAVQPPSMGMIAPVIDAASSLARKLASDATSVTCTNCLVGCACSSTSLMTWASVRPRALAVSGICFSTSGVHT